MVGLILLSMHDTLATKFGKIPELTSISAWETTLVVNFRCSSKVGPRCKSNLLLRTKLLLEKVTNGIISLLFFVLLRADINDSNIVNLQNVNILFKAFESFNLINLREIHLILDHIIPTLKHILLTCVIIYFLHNGLATSICFYFCLNVLSLILF